jgi:hypothetical protein
MTVTPWASNKASFVAQLPHNIHRALVLVNPESVLVLIFVLRMCTSNTMTLLIWVFVMQITAEEHSRKVNGRSLLTVVISPSAAG